MTESPTILIRTRLLRYVKWALAVLVLIYLFQIPWMVFHGKGQSRMGQAFETIAYEAFRNQHDALSKMQVFTADAGPGLCSFWNLEGIWGHCVVVVIHVRDYEPNYLPIVEREVVKLADQLRRPCDLLTKIEPADKQLLLRQLECEGYRINSSFKLRIVVNAVAVDDKREPSNRPPYRWTVTKRNELIEFNFKGEL